MGYAILSPYSQYGNAEQDDLWEYLTQAGYRDDALPTNLTVKTIMDTWTLQMGYPVITVERNDSDTDTVISQVRYYLYSHLLIDVEMLSLVARVILVFCSCVVIAIVRSGSF